MNDNLARLNPLIRELQELPDWPAAELPVGLMLYDVLVALDASQTELVQILGQETLALAEGAARQDAVQSDALRQDAAPIPSP